MILHSHHIVPLHTCKEPTCSGYSTQNKHSCGLDNPSNIIELTEENITSGWKLGRTYKNKGQPL